jgi:hypothetical protein
MIEQITNELIIASSILHTNKVSRIAEEIGYKPLIIMNGLWSGDADGKLTYNKKQDTITISPDVAIEHLLVTESMRELIDQLEIFIAFRNKDERDETTMDVVAFLGGTPELHVKIAVLASKKLTSYELHQPGDKKSVYTFITLKENADKQFGKAAFKPKAK